MGALLEYIAIHYTHVNAVRRKQVCACAHTHVHVLQRLYALGYSSRKNAAQQADFNESTLVTLTHSTHFDDVLTNSKSQLDTLYDTAPSGEQATNGEADKPRRRVCTRARMPAQSLHSRHCQV
jgi:hypothetical protein